MANWANIFYGAQQGVDEFKRQKDSANAYKAGAQLFAQLGTEEALGFADLMETDPDAAAIFAKEFGGASNLYQAMRENIYLGFDQDTKRMTAQAALLKARGAAQGSKVYDHPALAGILSEMGPGPYTDAQLARGIALATDAGIPVNEFLKAAKSIPEGPDAPDAPQAPLQAVTAIESDLQSRFLRESDTFKARAEAITTIESAEQNPGAIGDVDLMYAYLKMRDPIGAVREGEQALLKKAGGAPGALGAFAEAIMGTGSFSPEMRAQLIRNAKAEFGSFMRRHEHMEDVFRKDAEAAKVNPDRVALDLAGELRDRYGRKAPKRTVAPPALQEGDTLETDDNGNFRILHADGTTSELR